MARQALRAEYVAGLPRVKVARCPFTDAVVTHSLDTAGLDGLWWRYEDVVQQAEDLPATFFALTGAVRLGEPVEDVPFLVKPGPEAPYVVPRILLHNDVRAVVSQVAVGAHTGYAVTYFADPAPPLLARVNTWGANEHWFTDERGTWWDSSDEDESELDFELAPWVDSGKLRWVAPGDADGRLRTGLDGCPYVDLPAGGRTCACRTASRGPPRTSSSRLLVHDHEPPGVRLRREPHPVHAGVGEAERRRLAGRDRRLAVGNGDGVGDGVGVADVPAAAWRDAQPLRHHRPFRTTTALGWCANGRCHTTSATTSSATSPPAKPIVERRAPGARRGPDDRAERQAVGDVRGVRDRDQVPLAGQPVRRRERRHDGHRLQQHRHSRRPTSGQRPSATISVRDAEADAVDEVERATP